MGRLFLLFTVVPLLELYLLGRLAGMMGLGTTIALVLVTGVLGAALARAQGMRVLRQWQQALSEGRVPESGLTDALLVLVGGILLVTPGILTDAVGLLLMMSVPRRLIGAAVARHFQQRIAHGDVDFFEVRGFGGDPFGSHPQGRSPGAGRSPGPPHSHGRPHTGPPGGPRRDVPQDRDVIHVKATVKDVEPDEDRD